MGAGFVATAARLTPTDAGAFTLSRARDSNLSHATVRHFPRYIMAPQSSDKTCPASGPKVSLVERRRKTNVGQAGPFFERFSPCRHYAGAHRPAPYRIIVAIVIC